MNSASMSKFWILCAIVAGAIFTSTEIVRAEEVCRPCPFDCAGIGASRKDCKDLRRSRGECCVDLDDRGLDALDDADHDNSHRGVRPSCPSNSTFNGQHCVINDKRDVRPGGKGTINPCPRGMHLSGEYCVN